MRPSDHTPARAALNAQRPSPNAQLWFWLTRTTLGRILLVATAVKLLLGVAELALGGLPSLLELLDSLASLGLVLVVAYGVARLAIWARRRLLWRVRRKLILSYVFVGLVPSLLIVGFFLLSGLLLFFNVSSYLVHAQLTDLSDQARFLATSTLLDLQRGTGSASVSETLTRWQASAEVRYPFLSIAAVPVRDRRCAGRPPAAAGAFTAALPMRAGPWAHLDPPAEIPGWVPCEGFSGLLAYQIVPPEGSAADEARLVMRSVAFPDALAPAWAIVLDLPITSSVERQIRQNTGISLGGVSTIALELDDEGEADVPPAQVQGRTLPATAPPEDPGGAWLWNPRWVVFLKIVDWADGSDDQSANVGVIFHLREIYSQISAVTSDRLPGLDVGRVILVVLALVGLLFLIIQFVALALGVALARQITGAVHDLFAGTQRLRNRDFSHHIPVRARDQLGELADSFNVMTDEITTLLQENAKKERLEQELRTAREIQMKLLPQGPLRIPGLNVTAYCEPAREVGGDYYDFLPIDERRIGFLIADVSGKGTSAALYMAELKGLMLSLSRIHHSPRELLIAANRVIAEHIDAKSFITMTYLVIDLEQQTLAYARAGHCPLIYLPGPTHPEAKVQVLAPDGLVVGLKIDEDGQLFQSLLKEVSIALGPGDLIVLFTDGFSEAMNEQFDTFGEHRLSDLVQEHGHLPFEELREQILASVRDFSGSAAQHDDMTMLLLKVDDAGAMARA